MCSEIVAEGASSGLTIPTTYPFGNTSFLWFFLPLFYLREQFFSALLSDRCTSKSHAKACTQKSLEHLGVPLSQAEKASNMVQNIPNDKCLHAFSKAQE